MKKLRNQVVMLQDQLGQTAGIDPAYDRFRAGAIAAYMDLLNIDYEE